MILTLLLNRQVAAFAELGRLWQSVTTSFAEPILVTDAAVLRDIQALLEQETGRLSRIFDLTIDPDSDTFTGKAEQRITLARTQVYQFRITPEQMVYKLVNGAENFSEDDADWAEVLDFAAKTGKKLNCKPGNIQCGGKCQNGKLNCYANMTPAQKKAAQAAARKAKAATATATPTATPTKTTPANTKPKSAATTPPATASPIKTNQTELDRKRADLEKRFGKQTVEAAEKNVQRIFNDPDTSVFVRVGSTDTLEKILGNRFKTSAELGIDTHQIPYLKDGYQKARNRVEAKSLGYDEKTTQPDERPIYGYLGGKDLNGASHNDVSQAYGSIAIKLKPEVKDRTTFTGSDSFKSGIASEIKNDGTPPPPNAASLVSTTRHGYDRENLPKHYPSYYKDDSADGGQLRDAAKAKTIDDLAPKLALTGNAYVEAQVHGKVTPQDIGEIHFSPKGVNDRPNAAVAKFAKDNGIDLYVNGQKMNPDDIINAPKRSQRLIDLEDALNKGDFDAVSQHTEAIYNDAQKLKLAPGERDAVLKQLYTEAGFDNKPQVVSKQDLDNAAANGATLMVRGVSAGVNQRTEYFDQFKTGDYFVGNGVYGNGTYVGHSGNIKNDQFVAGNTTASAKQAWSGVAKHGYINSKSVTFRMALPADATVVTATQQQKDITDTRSKLNAWVSAERAKIKAAGTTYKKSDATKVDKAAQKLETDLAGKLGKPQIRRVSGGLFDEDQYISIPVQGRVPITFKIKKTSRRGTNWFAYTDADGNDLQFKKQADAIATATKDWYRRQAATDLGYPDYPKPGQSDAATTQKLRDFDKKASRIGEVLFGDMGNGTSGRFGVIRGVDAVALNNSYEPKTFMNLLNRSKVLVQDSELAYNDGKQKGAAA
jgi:hypothetical protein